MNELMTKVFVEQPLASPGSAKNLKKIMATIRIGQEIQCLQYAGFFSGKGMLILVVPENQV